MAQLLCIMHANPGVFGSTCLAQGPAGKRTLDSYYSVDKCQCRNNPQAFSNLLKRMLEASGRGMWQADDATLEQLKNMYSDMDAQLEGIK